MKMSRNCPNFLRGIIFTSLFCFLNPSHSKLWSAEGGERSGGPRTASTMSEVNQILQAVDFEVLLRTEAEISKGIGLAEGSYLLPLANYLDLNFIGAGKSVTLDPEAMIDFILGRLAQGESIETIGLGLVAEFKRTGFLPKVREQERPKKIDEAESGRTHIGGFLAGEFEYHQEPDGSYHRLLEINQARIYFATQLNPNAVGNNLSVLAEYNPVPEEVIHQIDEIWISRNGMTDTLRLPEQEIEGLIPFEQLYIKINDVAKSGVDLTVGQFRLPFGIWSDYTSHRNFSSTKNNYLVNGFALKKIELGILVEKSFASGVELKAALVHGRQGRTSPLDREDHDNKKDFVGRLGYAGGRFGVGASTYLAEFSFDRNVALGLDWLVSSDRLSLSGEVVLQKNNDVNATFATAMASHQQHQGEVIKSFDFNQVSSQGAYVQFDYSLTNKLHLYGLYETWRFLLDGKIVNDPTYKVFHGLRYLIHRQLRWTMFEYGRMFHNDFDKGNLHLSTQLEMTF